MKNAAAATVAERGEAGRARRSVYTWLAGAGLTATVSLAGFIATPLLLRWLGDTRWGAWEVVGEWLGYLGLTQLALGPGALTVFLLRAHTGQGQHGLTAVAKRGLRLYLWAGLALTPAAVGLAWWAPLGMHAAPRLAHELRWAVAIAALGGLAAAPAEMYRGVLETVQRGYVVRGALLLQSLAITGLSLWWVWLRWGLVGIACANAAGLSLGAGLLAWQARRWLPGWRAAAAAPLSAAEIWRINWPLMLALVGNQINLLTDNTVVGLTIGPAAVAGFALTQSLPLLAGARLTDIGGVSWAPLGELRARGDAMLGPRLVELAATVLGVGTVLLATVGIFNRAFVQLWVGARQYDGAGLTWATLASMAVFGLLCFFAWVIDTQGDTRRRMWVSAAGAGLNLGLSLWLVRRWGVTGVAVGTLIAYLCTDAWYLPYLAVRHYGVAGGELLKALGGALARGGAWAAVIIFAASRAPTPDSWPALIGAAAVVGAAAVIYCWAVVLRPMDRAAWRGRLRRTRG